MKFEIGNIVKIKSTNGSINMVGDVGEIVNITESDPDGLNYRVYVKGRTFDGKENISNWHSGIGLELTTKLYSIY
jgi:hypothetical protein